ncbi:MAG: hypothetical protein JO132_00110 [Streptosporangiaceae bacterium]|nr:hypothetical protein [Streptosporangiaceae bacterium]
MSDVVTRLRYQGPPEPAVADASLIAESLRVPERFALIFDRHGEAIHGYVARRLGPDAADDLAAETFLLAFQRRDGYDTRQDPGPSSRKPNRCGCRSTAPNPACST